ncbi:MAG: hypothetical protein WBI18_01690, partial [Candidatus Saccharicenans sp.]
FFKRQSDKPLRFFNSYPNSWPTTTPPPYTTLTLDTMSVPERTVNLTLPATETIMFVWHTQLH